MPGSVVWTSSPRPLSGSVSRAASTSSDERVVIDDEVVIVAAGEAELLVIVVDARADAFGGGEIEGRALHRPQLAGRDELRIHRREARGSYLEGVTENVADARAGEIEVAVLGEIDRRRRIGCRKEVDDDLAVGGQRVRDACSHFARIAFIAVGTDVVEPQADVLAVSKGPVVHTALLKPRFPPCR